MAFHDLYFSNGVQSRKPPTRSMEREWRGKMDQLMRRVTTTRSSIPKQSKAPDIPHLRHQPIGGELFTRERLHEINRQNRQLMGKMHDVLIGEKKYQTEEIQKIPKYVAKAEVERHRKRSIERENTNLLERVHKAKSAIHTTDYLKDYRGRCEMMARISRHPDHFLDTMSELDEQLTYRKRFSVSMPRLSALDDRLSTTSSTHSSRGSRKSSHLDGSSRRSGSKGDVTRGDKRRRRRHRSRSDSQPGQEGQDGQGEERAERRRQARKPRAGSGKPLPPIQKRSETWLDTE